MEVLTNIEYDSTNINYVIIEDYVKDAFRIPTPPVRVESKKPLLVLDLDETLVHSTYINRGTDLYAYDYYIHRRPFLEYFLVSISDYYDIAIWSAGTTNYVKATVDKIMPASIKPIFVFGRDMCDKRKHNGFTVYAKPLRWLEDYGYELNRTLIVDDSPEKCMDNFKNAIIPSPYYYNESDTELLDLLGYLKSIFDRDDFTEIEHYKWNKK